MKSRMLLHGVSCGRLARRAGVHPTHLSRWLNLHVKPSLENMLVLDEALDQIVSGHGA